MKKAKLNAKPVGEAKVSAQNNGITLIALIITIIVMLVLVGVTINVALTGGLFEKGEKAAYQTNAATVKEQVALKVAEELADNGGKAPAGGYTITIEQLQLSSKVEEEFRNKLTISKDGTLYYIEDAVNEKEKAWLEEIGIGKGSTIIGKTPLTQIKNGDVWNDVTFYATTISNQEITIPTTGIKAVRDGNGIYVPQKDGEGNNIPVQFDNTPNLLYIFFGGLEEGIGYAPMGSGYRIMFGNDYAAGFNTIDSNGIPVEDGAIYKVQNGNMYVENKINTNDLGNISFSGTLTAVAGGMIDGKSVYAIVPIDQDFRYWFTGDVTYAENDIYFE